MTTDQLDTAHLTTSPTSCLFLGEGCRLQHLAPGLRMNHSRDMEKIFTVEEANRTLPLVGRIVEDLVRDHAAWEDKVREFELATVGASPDHPDAIAELYKSKRSD